MTHHGATTPQDLPAGSPAGGAPASLLLATVFASGAAVMIVEMTAVRTVQPFFGSTTYVWTNVIAVVLAALALGYALGGRLADRCPSPRLLFGLLGAGGVLVGLGALLVTPVSRLFLQEGVDLEGVVSVLLWGSLGTSLVLFAPPILLLGAIGPIAVRLLAGRGVGRAAGAVFGTSTVGSIVGTYLPTFVLVPHLGSRGAILVAAGILLAASGVGLVLLGRRGVQGAAAAALVLGAGAGFAAAAGGVPPGRPPPPLRGGTAVVLEERESPYQYLTVREDRYPDGVERVLTVNEGVYTYHALDVVGRVMTGSRFYDSYTALPFLLDLEPGDRLRIGVVGLACGVGASQWHHVFSGLYDLEVHGAELDPGVLELGRRHFGLPSADAGWLHAHALDGRWMLEHQADDVHYDLVVVDAFANELYVPFHLATREFFSLCERRLAEGGVLAMNVHAKGEGAPNLAAIENTMAAVFGTVLRVPHYETGGFLLLARRGPSPVDPDRLAPVRIRRHLFAVPGMPDRFESPAWRDLLALADEIRATAGERGRTVTAGPLERVLTDDHAPLEWLTDRFLWSTEADRFGAGDARGQALVDLRDRQGRLLAVVAAVWAVALFAAWRGLARAQGG